MLAACGVSAVSQTAGPETVLCGEAELPYALIGFLTDYANGVSDVATPVPELTRLMGLSTEAFSLTLGHALQALPDGPLAVTGTHIRWN
jgi:purine nucleoside phosphorylase